jgi:hypothetical protein
LTIVISGFPDFAVRVRRVYPSEGSNISPEGSNSVSDIPSIYSGACDGGGGAPSEGASSSSTDISDAERVRRGLRPLGCGSSAALIP